MVILQKRSAKMLYRLRLADFWIVNRLRPLKIRRKLGIKLARMFAISAILCQIGFYQAKGERDIVSFVLNLFVVGMAAVLIFLQTALLKNAWRIKKPSYYLQLKSLIIFSNQDIRLVLWLLYPCHILMYHIFKGSEWMLFFAVSGILFIQMGLYTNCILASRIHKKPRNTTIR